MKKQEKSASSNAKIAVVFFAFLVFVVVVSLFIKIIAVVRSSQFDGSSRFTLSISNGKNIEVMSLDPASKNIVIFRLKDQALQGDVGRLLGIPIDGYIFQNSLDLSQNASSLFAKAIINCKKLKTNLTVIDFLRLAMLAKTIPESSIDGVTVGDTNELGINKVVDNLANDPFIEKDHQTIQIINGTDVSGFGNRLARLVTNMGGNVIIVATENSPRKKSVISYIDKKTYTVERLQKVLGYEVIRDNSNAISDITIVIGEDKIDSAPF